MVAQGKPLDRKSYTLLPPQSKYVEKDLRCPRLVFELVAIYLALLREAAVRLAFCASDRFHIRDCSRPFRPSNHKLAPNRQPLKSSVTMAQDRLAAGRMRGHDPPNPMSEGLGLGLRV